MERVQIHPLPLCRFCLLQLAVSLRGVIRVARPHKTLVGFKVNDALPSIKRHETPIKS